MLYYGREGFTMNMNIYIENNLDQQLRESAKALHKTRNSIIREAISEWLEHHKVHTVEPPQQGRQRSLGIHSQTNQGDHQVGFLIQD